LSGSYGFAALIARCGMYPPVRHGRSVSGSEGQSVWRAGASGPTDAEGGEEEGGALNRDEI